MKEAGVIPIDGPLAGFENYASPEPTLMVPFVVQEHQSAEVQPWIGVLLACGWVVYERGHYQGSFVRVACCAESWPHKGLDHERWTVEIPASAPLVAARVITSSVNARGMRSPMFHVKHATSCPVLRPDPL